MTKQELEKKWQKLTKKADQTVDGLGCRIDEGIKETVVALWAQGLKTNGSCEGHLDWGLPFPWVDMEVTINVIPPETPMSIGLLKNIEPQLSILWKEAAKKEWPQKDWQKIQEYLKKNHETHWKNYHESNEMREYQKAESKQYRPIHKKVWCLLDEFYKNHNQSDSRIRLILAYQRLQAAHFFGAEYLTKKDKKEFLKASQEEMKAFTVFLKDKFFNQS